MVDGKMLTEKTKEELIKIILDQDTRIRELEETIKAEKKKRTEKFAKPIRRISARSVLDKRLGMWG